MLNVSPHGAAMLTPRSSRPAAGEHVSLSLVDPALTTGAEVESCLLDRAQVLRVEPAAASLERVAMQFDSDLWSRDAARLWEDLDRLFTEETTATA
jgi:hypothetical protein